MNIMLGKPTKVFDVFFATNLEAGSNVCVFVFHIAVNSQGNFPSFVRLVKGSKREYVKTLEVSHAHHDHHHAHHGGIPRILGKQMGKDAPLGCPRNGCKWLVSGL